MGPTPFATRFSTFTSLRHARKLLLWPVFSTALGACGLGDHDHDSDHVATAAQAQGPIASPGVPAILRDVHLIEGAIDGDPEVQGDDDPGDYTYPIIPPFRTSADGRIGVDMASGHFFLLSPEKLIAPVTGPQAPPGPNIVLRELSLVNDASTTNDDFFLKSDYQSPSLYRSASLGHQTICDSTPQFGYGANTVLNPHPCDPTNVKYQDPTGSLTTQDCYSLTMISVVEFEDRTNPQSFEKKVQYWGKSFTAVVANPKTTLASLSVSFSPAPPTPGPAFHAEVTHSPSVTTDGRLFVAKLGKSRVDPDSGAARAPLDIVYSTYPAIDPATSAPTSPCDVSKWTSLRPLSEAHTDPNMVGRYGIAAYPIKDPQGTAFLPGGDLQVSYPWLDRAGDNLFFTTLQATLFNEDTSNGAIKVRYPEQCLNGGTCTPDPTTLTELKDFEETENFRGVGVAGLWTHGKMVLLDSAINNIDYGLGRSDDDQRELALYTNALNNPYWVRAGTGKYPGGEAPPLSTGNTGFIDSLENLFNWNKNLKPLAVRDVVWTLNTGKASAELIFDDYLDPNALIIAEMAGALELDTTPNADSLKYYDGWNQKGRGKINSSVAREVRFQNAATSPAWDLPKFGTASPDVRLEPVALGGIEGKGAWLDGTGDFISFNIPDQSAAQPPKVMTQYPWYLSIFVDPRFNNDTVRRKLFTFGDGSGIVLVGQTFIEYENATGTVFQSINISHSALKLVRGAWSHLAFAIDYPSNRIHLFVNGYLVASLPGVFYLPGSLQVGDAPGDSLAGFAGWIDEVKLLAYRPTLELACNHARGTLMKVSAQSGKWLSLAQAYPAPGHDLISSALGTAAGPKYVCYHDYLDHRRSNPRFVDPALGMTSIREQLTFPEGPLHYNLPRPISSANPFCLTCHQPSAPHGLGLNALTGGFVQMQNDVRRQPMMPPRMMFGNVPAYLFGSGPAYNVSAVATAIDPYVFP